MSAFYHEELYRTPELVGRLKETRVTVCGAGALGANITESLARSGFARLSVIGRDRIEERNLSTQPYYRSDVGAFKAKITSNTIFRALGILVESRPVELTMENAHKLLRDSELVIDAFDNSLSRGIVKRVCETQSVPCLHAGLAPDYAEIIWNEIYRVPSPAQDDVCDYPLARNLATLTCAVACEVIINYIATGRRDSYTITLGDFAVRPYCP